MEVISRGDAKKAGLKFYFTGNKCKNGHVSKRRVSGACCVDCTHEYSVKYRSENKEKIALQSKDYRFINKEKIRLTAKKYELKNKDRIYKVKKEYRIKNKDKIAKYEESRRDDKLVYSKEYYIKNKVKLNDLSRDYYKNNKESILKKQKITGNKTGGPKAWREANKGKLSEYMRNYRNENYEAFFIRESVRRVLIGRKDSILESEIVCGYSQEHLRCRIEFQFKAGMNWDNYGDWHLDHIKPVSRFVSQGETNPRIVNALSNLQPLWAEENMSKGSKFKRGVRC